MKVVMMSCSPKECCNILNYIQSLLVRKKFPKDYKGWVYICCTKDRKNFLYHDSEKGFNWFISPNSKMRIDFKYAKGLSGFFNGKVVARFYCDNVKEISCYSKGCYPYPYSIDILLSNELEKKSCLTNRELENYLGTKDCSVGSVGYAIHISQLEIFDKPKELSEFGYYCKNNDKMYFKMGYCRNCKKRNCRYGGWIDLTKAPLNFCYVEVEQLTQEEYDLLKEVVLDNVD